MKVLVGLALGAGLTIGWLYSWRALIGYALSRGD